MTWVLWDIFVPLLTSFGLGALLGWSLWRSRSQFAAVDSIVVSDSMPLEGIKRADVESTARVGEVEAANVVLIQERDLAINELEDLQAKGEVLQERIEELENLSRQEAEESSTSDNLREEVNAIEKSKKLEEQTAELEEKLEKLTVDCQEERKTRRELELELLNAQNHCEKLEAQNLSTADAEEQASELEQERSRALRADFEALEITHAKLQAELEEQKHSAQNARQSIDSKQTEIEELNASLTELREAPAVSIQQHKKEVGSRDAEIDALKKKLEGDTQHTTEERQDAQTQVDSLVESLQVPGMATEPAKPTEDDVAVKTTVVKNSKVQATSTGYVPTHWSVPGKKPAKSERDELTAIKGVGPVLEKVLHDTGIYYYQQVAVLDKDGIKELQEQIPQFPGRIRRDQWVKQAKKLHQSKYGEAAESLS